MLDTTVVERERELLEHVGLLARALRAERERLASRLSELEHELSVLAVKLDGEPAVVTLAPRRS